MVNYFVIVLLLVSLVYAERSKISVIDSTRLETDGSAITDGISVGKCVWFVAEGSSQLISYCNRNTTKYYELYINSPDILASDGNVIYFASSMSGQIGSFDISDSKVQILLYLGQASPSSLLVDEGYLYVTLYNARAIVLYNIDSGEITNRYKLDQPPTDITKYNQEICVGSKSGIACYKNLSQQPKYVSFSKVTSFVPQFNQSLCYLNSDDNIIGCVSDQEPESQVCLGKDKGPRAGLSINNNILVAEFNENAIAMLNGNSFQEYHIFDFDNNPVYGITGGPSALGFLPDGSLVVASWSQNKIYKLQIN
jgi:hypothetical protein